MPGLSRFDFYPRDWHLDTRDLSAAAKGIYIDLLSGIYARGGPLPYKERELCQLCGCATARSLRPLLDELIRKGKLKVIDGHIWNGRAMEEITKAERRQAIAREGGKAKSEHQKTLREAYNQHLAEDVQPEFGSNSVRTRLETRSDIEENQQGNSCSPSPSPSIGSVVDKSTTGAGAPLLEKKKRLYDLGREVFGKLSGGYTTRLLNHCVGDIDVAYRTLEVASAKSDPREYVGAILRGDRQPDSDWAAEYRRMGVSL